MQTLLKEIKSCEICKEYLHFAPKPILSVDKESRILLIGQAPGIKVHNSGIPWDDASGKELRRWLEVSENQFYNNKIFAIMPMGMCYPGTGKNGDLPPRPECAPKWHPNVLKNLENIELVILIGMYAQKYYLPCSSNSTLTENVKNYNKYLPQFFPLVHPSPRNKIWQKKNPWFEAEIIPELRKKIREIITHD